jgi:hypothetical protein
MQFCSGTAGKTGVHHLNHKLQTLNSPPHCRLRAEGCPWDAFACERAAQSGQLATLQWLRANGLDSTGVVA